MGFSSASTKLWSTNQHWKLEKHTPNLSKYLSHIFWKYSLFVMLYTLWASIVFSPKQIHLPEVPELAASAVACYILLKQSKGIRKKNKNLSSEGRFQQSDLPFEETAEWLQCVRRQVESRFCLHQQLTSRWSLTPLWTLFELPWQLVWYEMLPPPASRTFVMLHKAAGFWWTPCSSQVYEREMVGSAGEMPQVWVAFSFGFCQFSIEAARKITLGTDVVPAIERGLIGFQPPGMSSNNHN